MVEREAILRDYCDDGLDLQEIASAIDNETGEKVVMLRLGPRGLAQAARTKQGRSIGSVDFRLSPLRAQEVGKPLLELGRELAQSVH